LHQSYCPSNAARVKRRGGGLHQGDEWASAEIHVARKEKAKKYKKGVSRLLQILADDIRTKNAFVWGDLNARNQPNAFSYGET